MYAYMCIHGCMQYMFGRLPACIHMYMDVNHFPIADSSYHWTTCPTRFFRILTYHCARFGQVKNVFYRPTGVQTPLLTDVNLSLPNHR